MGLSFDLRRAYENDIAAFARLLHDGCELSTLSHML